MGSYISLLFVASHQPWESPEIEPFYLTGWTAMCSHIPNKGEQMVRYYGYYSNVSRGRRKKENRDSPVPSILEPVESLQVERPDQDPKAYRKSWARLIQKIYDQQAHCTLYSGCGKNFPNHPPLPPALGSGLQISFISSKLATGVDLLSRR